MALPSSILQRGLRAAQPAATSVAVGVTYYVEDELLTEQSNGTIWEPYSAAGAGTGDVSGPGSSVDKEIALFDGTGGVLLERATGTGIVRVTSGVYGTPGNVVESEITLADNTTNNVSITKHGFAPKSPNDATQYLDGTGAYSVPAGSGGGTRQLTFVFDGGGAELVVGSKARLYCAYACTITESTLFIDQTGDLVVDVWVDAFANYPPDNADSITAAAPPTISGGLTDQDSTLTGWDLSVAADSFIFVNVDSVTDATWAQLVLTVTV